MNEIEQKNRGAVEDARLEEAEAEIDLLEVLYRLLERWKWIAAGAIVGVLVMFVYSFMLATPIYEATSKLYVLNSSDSALNLSDLQIGSYLAADYIEVFDTWEIQEMVRQNLQLSYTNEEMRDMLTISNPSNTRILYLTVRSSNPQEAAAVANEYAAVGKRYISSTMQTDEPSVLSEAQVPTRTVSPRKLLNMALGMILGIFAVCAVIVVQFLLDDKVKTEEDIRKSTGLPTLAVVPDDSEAAKDPRERAIAGKSGKKTSRRSK